MLNTNGNITTTESQLPVWYVATVWDVEPELTEAKRDSSGEWLKRNVKLESPKGSFSAAQKAMAELYDSEPEMLFSAKR